MDRDGKERRPQRVVLLVTSDKEQAMCMVLSEAGPNVPQIDRASLYGHGRVRLYGCWRYDKLAPQAARRWLSVIVGFTSKQSKLAEGKHRPRQCGNHGEGAKWLNVKQITQFISTYRWRKTQSPSDDRCFRPFTSPNNLHERYFYLSAVALDVGGGLAASTDGRRVRYLRQLHALGLSVGDVRSAFRIREEF